MSLSSPLIAKTEMPYSSTSAAATSSCVDSGFDAQRTTSAPPAWSVRARFAVSVVTCRHAEIRCPASGCSRSKRSRIAASTGICRSAHAIRRTPSAASARSFTSYRCVVAIDPLFARVSGGPVSGRLGCEQALLLSLLPLDPGRGNALGAGTLVPASQVSTAARSAGSRRSRARTRARRARRRSLRGARRARELVELADSVAPIAAASGPGRRGPPARGSAASAQTSPSAGPPPRSSSNGCTVTLPGLSMLWSGSNGGPGRGTGVEWMIEVVVEPVDRVSGRGSPRARRSSAGGASRR